MDLPDLIVVPGSLSVTTETGSDVYFPNSVLSVRGRIRNQGGVRTQEGIQFPLVAELRNQSDVLVDSETVIVPAQNSNGNNAGGFPYIEQNGEQEFRIGNIHLPDDTSPGDTFYLRLEVDRNVGNFNGIIAETDNANNHLHGDREVNELFDDELEITITRNNGAALEVDRDSFVGDIGSFYGLDPIRISFTVRNNGFSPVQADQQFITQIALSKDLTFDVDDFVLREFDLSGDALGSNLLPRETITLDWVQQLPDNIDGDFYFLVNIEGNTFSLENTPSISLTSSFKGATNLVEGPGNTIRQGGERPSASKNGRIVAYEKEVNGIQQIYYMDLLAGGEPILVSRNFITDSDGNGNSYKPKVSADGGTIVFHSSASDLVPGDFNNQMDVFLFRLSSSELVRAYNQNLNDESDGPSFNPAVNENGKVVAFESTATNLQSSGEKTMGRQIFVWNTANLASSSIYTITSGNGESRTPSIDASGNAIVFCSDASDINAVNFGIDLATGQNISTDLNGQTDIFLHNIDSNTTYLVNLNKFMVHAEGGASDQPAISGDGSMIVYRSRATNLVFEKGIATVEVQNGGVGYFGSPTILIADLNQSGTGAVLGFNSDAIDEFGQISPSALNILNHGENYTSPIVSVIPDPNQPSPSEIASIKVHLSHPLGEIYAISTADVTNQSASSVRQYSKRISENPNKVGGNMQSREPSISHDGKLITYSTKSSNLLDSNITRADGNVFYNLPVLAAQAEAILVGGIGEIEVDAPGSGYSNGFLFINDISGSGSGAVASYQVDTFGRIASVNIVNPGTDYNLDTTFISVESPRFGTGFSARATRFDQGGRIQRIQMTQNGSGYQNIPSTTQGKTGLISIDGDGRDSDGDGKPDAKINPDRIYIDYNQTGGVYISNKMLKSSCCLLTTC